MPGIPYKAAMPSVAVTVAQDLYEITPASGKPIAVRRVVVEQSSDTDSEQLRLVISRFSSASTSGSGGSTITPKSPLAGAGAASAVVERNNTTVCTGGTQEILESRAFNVINGLEMFYDPPIEIKAADRFVVNLPNAPGDSLTFEGFVEFDEFG